MTKRTPDASTQATDTGPAPAQGAGDMRTEVERLTGENKMLFERLARAQAEFTNARRRLEQDQEQAMQFANQALLKSMLPIMDNLERAIAVDPAQADVAGMLQGVQVVRDLFEAMLRQQRVEIVSPKPGDAFEPATMEALLHQPSDHTEGSVAMLLNKGYTLMGRTLRPAQVAVAKPK
jgi:molecular chaperone GrpE